MYLSCTTTFVFRGNGAFEIASQVVSEQVGRLSPLWNRFGHYHVGDQEECDSHAVIFIMDAQSRCMRPLSLKELVVVSETMMRLISGMLGPAGSQTLLSTAAGQAIVSRDGLMVLSAVHLNHPVAECILSAVKNYHALAGDGCKIFLVYLQAALKAIENLASAVELPYFRIDICQKLCYFLLEEFPFFSSVMYKKCSVVCTNTDFYSIVRNILRTALNTSLPSYAAGFFTEMLCCYFEVETLFSWRKDQIYEYLSQMLHFVDTCYIKICGHPYQKSEIVSGVLLENEFVVPLADFCKTQGNLRVMMLSCLIESDSTETVSPCEKAAMENCFLQKRVQCKSFVESVKATGVDIILLSECCPHYFQGICRDFSVAVVQYVDTEKLNFISYLTGAFPLHELRGEFISQGTFAADICKRMKIGNKLFILVKPSKVQMPWNLGKQIIVCAPTDGLCNQICASLRKAIVSLRMCLCFESCTVSSEYTSKLLLSEPVTGCRADSGHTVCVVGAGGCFEALLLKVFHEQLNSRGQSISRQMSVLLQEMLISVPRILCSNASSSQFQTPHEFLCRWSAIVQGTSQGLALGFSHCADVVDMNRAGLLEPVHSKLLLVFHVLQLVQQLLRLDAVVGVKRQK